jgi:hypothetical protein
MQIHRSIAHRLAGRKRAVTAAGAAVALAGVSALSALPAAAQSHHHRQAKPTPPLTVTVFSPGAGDHSGAGGVGFIVDLSIDATKASDNPLLSAQNGYQPAFIPPTAPSFHPGPDPAAPGLVVLLSSTPNMPGTPFQGPRTNLAGLFQINGVARVSGNRAETWNTWQPGKPIFGTGPTRLTVFVVRGTAPSVVPTNVKPISNVVRVPFSING